MAILRASEIRAMSRDEMLAKLTELRAELVRSRATTAAGGTLENPAKIKEIRHTIARIITIMKEKGGA
ncbi:MAG: 50S ribosomal protein L29 [Candidatus Hadarchaeota archaeon]